MIKKNVDKENKENFSIHKLSLAIVFSILCYIVLAIVINALYNPDIEGLLIKAKTIIRESLMYGVFPEPKEKIIYLLGISVIPIFIVLYIYILKDLILKYKVKKIIEIGSIFLYTVIGISTLFLKDSYFDNTLFKTYFNNLFTDNYSYIYILLTYLIVASYFILNISKNQIINRFLQWFCLVLFLIIPLFIVFLGNIYSFPPGPYHFNAVFYSQTQVFKGIPMLVDGFTNTYGLYPHFLNPVFHIFGLSTYSFSATMSILLVINFVSIYWFFTRETKNKWITLFGIGSILLNYIYWKNMSGDSYFQFFPVRTLFPCLMLLLASFYKTKLNIFYFILISSFCSIGVLWNPDLGVFTFLSWIAFSVYIHTIELPNIIDTLKRAIIIICIGVATLLTTFLVYSLTILYLYGSIPNLNLLFSTIFIFSQIGYYMLPMQIFHPWLIVAIWIIIGIGISLLSYKKGNNEYSIVFFMCFISLGALSYYQGRSHSLNFAGVSPFFLILLCLLISKINFNPISIQLRFFKYSGIFILLITVPSLIKYDILFFTNKNILFNIKAEMPQNVKSNIAFIKRNSKPGEKVLILIDDNTLQGIYHNETQTISAFNPGIIDMFLMKDENNLHQMLKKNMVKVFNRIETADSTFKHIDDNGEIGLYLTNTHCKN